MALKTVSQYKDSVSGLLSGIDLSQVDDLNGALERAARVLVQKADVPEASGTQNIVLYSGVTDYACDTRIFGTAINDIRPQGINRSPNDFVIKTQGSNFDRTKNFVYSGTMSTFEYSNGVPIIRIVVPFATQKINIGPTNSLTGVTAGGSLSNLVLDNAVYYQQPSSFRFNLTGSSAGTLTTVLSSSVDLSSYEGVGVAFMAIRIPDGATASDLTSLSLRLGSSSGNYDQVTSTTGFLGSWVAGDWLLVAFDFSGATTTGTPDWSEIDYIYTSIAHTASFTNFRIGGLWVSMPTPAQILYQSAAIFKASGLPTSENITSNNDEIILNNPSYTLYQYEGALSVLEQTGASEASNVYQTIFKKLNGNGSTDMGLYNHFRGDNPSQELRTIGSYYNINNNNNLY